MPSRRETLREGVVVGLIGYAAVALFYSAFDFLASRGTLYTVNLLGNAVFRRLRDPSVLMFPLPTDWTAVLWYNALHFTLALVIGVIVTGFVAFSDRNPARRGLVRLIIVAGFVVTIMLVATLTTPIRPLLPMWSVVGANVLATLLAGSYLIRARPGLWSRLALGSADSNENLSGGPASFEGRVRIPDASEGILGIDTNPKLSSDEPVEKITRAP